MKYILRSLLRSTGYDIFRVKFQTHENCEYSTITPYASYSPWLNDTNFQSVYQIVKANTLVDVYRCYELWQTVAQSQHVEGDILEVGVWRGGTGCLIAKQAPNKTVYLCDTFEGVVKAGENDSGYTGGEHADTSQNIVNKLADTLNVKNISILKDASSTAIYGSRGSNGVVLVTTKSGREGKLSVSLNSFIGYKLLAKKMLFLHLFIRAAFP